VDKVTNVWAVALAPLDDPEASSLVATVGGSSVCLTDVSLARVVYKYTYVHEVRDGL
jgi:hypothetical protein